MQLRLSDDNQTTTKRLGLRVQEYGYNFEKR